MNWHRIFFPILIAVNAFFINKAPTGWFNAIVVGFVCGIWVAIEMNNFLCKPK